MYEDEFELTFQVPEEESAPEPLAAPAAKPAAPVEPVVDEPTRIMTLEKTAAPVAEEPTRVITLEKPAEPPAVEPPEEPAPQPVKERPAPAAPAAARRVLISGGDRGIGAAAALEQQLPGCIAIQCDVASRASCELAFHAVEQAMGRVDVLVCNAGIAQQKLFTDITPEEWQRMLDVNLSGAFHLCQLALPGMIRRKQGRILTVSSMWGQTGGSCEVHYSAAKAGLIGLTKALAKEEGPSGITVNCVAPGVIETDMMAAFTAEDKAALAEETPVGRLGTPEEVAKLLVFLAGEDAGYITGQVFGVNGGLVI